MQRVHQSPILDMSREESTVNYNQSMIVGGNNPYRNSNLASWAKQAGQNLNNSAVLPQKGMNLPQKLQRMKERFKRDRSADIVNDQPTEKVSLLNEETQRLRDTYSKHRKPGSKSQLAQRNILQKSFKEDELVLRDRSLDFNKPNRESDKENVLRQSTQTENRYKRSQQKSQQALASYQQKYERLEKNFKKFTNNIKHANQTESVIGGLKIKNGLAIIVNFTKKNALKDIKWAVKLWRLNSGITQKLYENQSKTVVLAKCAEKIYKRSLNHLKIMYYQQWKRMVIKDLGPEKMVAKLSEIITNSEDFNRCVENDYFLTQILTKKLLKIIGGMLTSDMLFHCQDEEPAMKTYKNGEQINLNIEALLNHSILGQMISEESVIFISQAITTHAKFNKEVDMPMNQDDIAQFNKMETNSFNKVRGLSVVLLNLGHLGILRLFFSTQGSQPTNQQMKQVKHLQRYLPDFLQRIQDVRTQINTLAIQSIQQTEQINVLESYNSMNQHLKGLNDMLMKLQTSEEVVQVAKQELEKYFDQFFDLQNAVLRQIVDGKDMMLPQNKDLVRFNNHVQECKETIEDFLDYKKDYYIHQISVCPKMPGQMQFSNFTFIVHIYNQYEPQAQKDVRDMSTTLNSFGTSTLIPRFEKKYLDDELKHKLAFYLRGFCPILQQNMFITGDIGQRIEKLEKELLEDQKKYDLQQMLHTFVSSEALLTEQNELLFSSKVSLCLTQAYLAFTGNQVDFCCFFNSFVFHRKSSKFEFCGYIEEEWMTIINESVLKNRKKDQYQLNSIGQEISEVEVRSDLIATQLNLPPGLAALPMFANKKLIALFILEPVGDASVFAREIEIFLADFIVKRHSVQNIQDSYDKLAIRIEGEKISQATKDLLDEALVFPFLKNQSLKSLGDGIDFLSDRLVQNVQADDQWQPGQEISQIVFINSKVYIEEVRLLGSYTQLNVRQDPMIIQSFKKMQMIVFEDDDLQKVVVLHPIEATNKSKNTLILRFVIDKDSQTSQKVENIRCQLVNLIKPFISVSLNCCFSKQSLALAKLTAVLDKYKCANYREIVYFMRDLKAKNVFNFSRSRLYEKIAKSKRYFELKKSEDQFFDMDQKHLKQNQIIQHMIRQALVTMNKQAFKFKQSYFKKFVIGTRKEVYAPLSKKKKRALTILMNFYSLCTLRSLFTKFAINTHTFKHIRHPKTKYLASVNCLFRNYRIVRQRLAFLRLKKNLNMQLRESMASYRENDKDFFIQLNQILVSSHQQQGGLDGGFQYAMSEIFIYLKNLSSQELKIQDLGFRADDGFVGHIDEVVLTMKSQVYTSHGSIGQPSQASRIKIFMGNFKQNGYQRNGALMLSYDSQNPLSQQEQILNQINASNVDNNWDIDLSQQNMFAQGFQLFEIAQKRDLIHQMLVKSNGVIFNFQNIQQSLSDIFLTQQSSNRDHSIGNRFAVVRRSKSALIIPLFDVSQQTIIGSLELYRHHSQAFTDEIEQRYDYFSKRLADFLLIYGQLKQQSFQIDQLKWQMQKQVKASQSLSALLKNVYVNAPANHFPGASHVLPIIILNEQMQQEVWEDDFTERSVFDKKLAFFYQFKDNHIYNFDYEGTFLDELMENGCILEMCQKNTMKRDENIANAGGLSHQTSLDDINQLSSAKGSSLGTGRLVARHKTIQSQTEKVKSITNDLFKHLIYYPVFEQQNPQKIVAIFEVGFKKQVDYEIMTDDIQHYLNQFESQLTQFKVRLSSFSKSLENLVSSRQKKSLIQKFQLWKQMMVFSQYREQFQSNQYQVLQNQEMTYSEYVNNLNQFNNQLKSIQDEKNHLERQVEQFHIEKKAKLKFLATSLVSSQNLFRKAQANKLKQAFLKWQYNVSIRKIAETAFSRVLELNHRHSYARFKTAVFLLQGLVEKNALHEGFKYILRTAHMRPSGWQAKYIPHNIDLRRSRSRSLRAGESSTYVLNNVTSLLSPQNLRKVETKNLYENQISSFYTPGGSKKLDTSIVQLKPHVHDRTQNSATRSNSRYNTCGEEGWKENPYSELNVSQVEFTTRKRDYSPIITTSKHDLKKIYGGKPTGFETQIHKAHSSLSHKKSRSMENCRQGRTKSELQKQLYLKQKQLTMLKRQLQMQNGGEITSKQQVDSKQTPNISSEMAEMFHLR